MADVPKLELVLIVEDNVALLRALGRHVASWGARAMEVRTCAAAQLQLAESPDLIICDIKLPDGSGTDVLEQAGSIWPKPLLVAISGEASPEEAFRLAQIGVRAYLPKPLSLEQLTQAVHAARTQAPNLEGLFSASVGRVPLKQMQGQMRDTMLHQALAMSDGSRSGAARLLHVSRQAVQQILRGDRKDKSDADPGTSTH